MKLTGTKTQEVEVEITAQEMIRGLYYECGLGAVYDSFTSSRTYWKENEDGTLQEETDESYHGSPWYCPTGRVIDDQKKLRAYHLLKELTNILEDIENDKMDS